MLFPLGIAANGYKFTISIGNVFPFSVRAGSYVRNFSISWRQGTMATSGTFQWWNSTRQRVRCRQQRNNQTLPAVIWKYHLPKVVSGNNRGASARLFISLDDYTAEGKSITTSFINKCSRLSTQTVRHTCCWLGKIFRARFSRFACAQGAVPAWDGYQPLSAI